jgi:hypothetical protein
LARATYTPIPFFLDMRIQELIMWIEDINSAMEEDKGK